MSLEEGAIDQTEYERQVQQLAEGYEANIQDLHMRVESFQLDTIAEAFGSSLEGVLPGIEGTVSEKLSGAMNNALAINPEPMEWSQDQIASWFGLEGLGAETQAAVSGLLQQTAQTIPQSMKDPITESMLEVDYSGIDFVRPFSDEFFTQMGSIDFSSSGSSVVSGLGSAIQNADMGAINSAIDTLKASTDSTIDSVFGEGVSTTMPVNVKADYKLLNPTALVSIGSGGSGTTTLTASISSHANGGFVSGAQLSWLAEEGYGEFVIPTNPARRDRALELYEQAGKALGIPMYADGGTAGRITPVLEPAGGSGGGNFSVTIENMTLEINVDGSQAQDPQAVAEAIKENLQGMTDEIAYQLALALKQSFANTPKEQWG